MTKQKKSQAALEFLATYGWAMAIMVIVLGALAYYKIFNPGSFLPERCTLGAELSCLDFKLSQTDAGTVFLE